MSFLFLFLFLLSFPFLLPPAFPLPYPYNTSYHIDCGYLTPSTDSYNVSWSPDQFFTGGSSAVVSEPLHFHLQQEKTLRYFPLSSGKKNCYNVPLPAGRYYIRTFTVYDNYDGKSHSPSFDASVEGTLVFSWRSPWPENLARDGAYSDLFAFVKDGQLDFCFYSIATDPPVIGSLEVVQIDPLSYNSAGTGDSYILVNYGRLSPGSSQWGPGFTTDQDLFGRSWQSDSGYRTAKSKSARVMTTNEKITGTEQAPNYFPMKLYQSAVTIDGGLEYELAVDAKLDYMVWFHFAEFDSTVKKAGERVFDVLVNEKNVSRVDIFKQVGSFAAYSLNYTEKNLSSSVLNVKLLPVVGAPLICGLENYAMVPADLSTVPEQVIAMRALKDSLRVPDRMGWNGDPCAPTDWDAWEGVTCHANKNGTGLVITQIDLGSQGLKGYIGDKISLLSNLVNLNLSANSLEGTLPIGLGQISLARLDLSNNQFSGSIPESLTSSSLQLVRLDNNLLEGRVPEELYSVGVHGGTIYLSGNKGLCGVPPLPDCPLFWENGHLSNGAKIAIGISCFVFVLVLLLVIYIFCIRRGKNDYDFGLPSDLMFAAKRNRYQRQKSLMLLEMESQHAKGLPSLPLNPH
ncbi:putative leucine-rich repeat receptor-like serine/threonine-protein kinase At2g14440 [Durio zibethinus]|uniref:Leucine-rich repeat receptor-like serine/threonine-protein kinase At2g14440 n=1 Tax=Durio zibethinus TaxID=66656 RepID=A0A6P6BIR5_DURZI|nr:putative leucine-rich repeat receptor-like serine/threonine-protein kinase At2g14440 [Durio zibethinus]